MDLSCIVLLDYFEVFEEIQQILTNSTAIGLAAPALSYMQGSGESFGGNLSVQKRLSYLDHRDGTIEIPCGFFKPFPIAISG